MKSMQQLKTVPDDDLLERLAALLQGSRDTEAELVAHIAEVDARRLYVREAAPSMFQYCTERLHLSGPEAYLRIAAARVSRQHPVVLTMLADGRLHLTAIALLAASHPDEPGCPPPAGDAQDGARRGDRRELLPDRMHRR
jgi:hypothetical protein